MMNKLKKDDDLINEIISFWFSDEVQPLWFKSTDEFDDLLCQRYKATWELACAGNYDHWQLEANGALALVIVLDQFPLNMFRQDKRQYSTESHARKIAEYAIQQGLDNQLTDQQKAFIYLPYMHSESLDDQNLAVSLYERAGLESNLGFAKHHRDVVKQFGRFPHRNIALGRESTEQEIEYLKKSNW